MSGPNITHYLTKINQQLANVWPTDSSTKLGQQLNVGLEEQLALNALTMPLNALLQRAGKRWRPLVMVLTAQSFGQNEEDSLYFTPLVELPHSGSLVIDDIEDGSTLRRQLPAIHLMYGLDCAINSANLAYFSPTSLIDNYRCNDKLKYLIYKSYSKAMRSVHLGQGLDIAWHNDALFIPNVQQYYTMCRLKTGALAAMAAEVGA
jgi:octaprenyl-diphosphate synthase